MFIPQTYNEHGSFEPTKMFGDIIKSIAPTKFKKKLFQFLQNRQILLKSRIISKDD